LWVRIPLRWGVLDAPLCEKVCQWLAAGLWFSPGTLVSPTKKTDLHDITETLLNTIMLTLLYLWLHLPEYWGSNNPFLGSIRGGNPKYEWGKRGSLKSRGSCGSTCGGWGVGPTPRSTVSISVSRFFEVVEGSSSTLGKWQLGGRLTNNVLRDFCNVSAVINRTKMYD
jgi:hypothetical protein